MLIRKWLLTITSAKQNFLENSVKVIRIYIKHYEFGPNNKCHFYRAAPIPKLCGHLKKKFSL